MVKVKPLAVAQRRYHENVLRAYLEGKQNQNWVVGCLRGIKLETYDEIARELPFHMRFPRYQEIPDIRSRLVNISDK
ncbi:MAG: hypothetical protein ACFFER_17795 [Candidatus Thorarchaeota archaeon]